MPVLFLVHRAFPFLRAIEEAILSVMRNVGNGSSTAAPGLLPGAAPAAGRRDHCGPTSLKQDATLPRADHLVWWIGEKEDRMPAISEWLRVGAASVVIAASTYGAIPARATDVTAEWSTIQMPPPPTLKPVTVDPKRTALLLFDFMGENCGKRPRCVAAVPTLKALHDRARAANMLVAYTLPGGGKIIDEGIAPREGEVVDQNAGGPDKFQGDDLDQRLKAHGIKTVILCGTSAQGVGLGTGAAAAQRGYYVIYPVDCLLSESPFREAYAAWHMAGGGPPVTTKWVTVTRSDMITFENAKR
jgi:nicotinamidase-related amidase